MNYFKPILALFIVLIGSTRGFNLGIFQNYEVHVINNAEHSSDELVVHCQSGDDDLGEHFLDNGEDWNWKFRLNLFRSTFFFCDLQMGEMERRFAAFDTDDISYKCEETSSCFWSVRVEGIFFSCDNKSYVKTHDWLRRVY